MMENLFIEANIDTPEVNFDYGKRLISISGKSYPGNTYEFYSPILNWLKEYFSECGDLETTINIQYMYFNSGTSQAIYSIFDIVKESKCQNIRINWFYRAENDEEYEEFEDISEEFPSLNFTAVAY